MIDTANTQAEALLRRFQSNLGDYDTDYELSSACDRVIAALTAARGSQLANPEAMNALASIILIERNRSSSDAEKVESMARTARAALEAAGLAGGGKAGGEKGGRPHAVRVGMKLLPCYCGNNADHEASTAPAPVEDAHPESAARQEAVAPEQYRVGNTYRTLGGELVTLVGVANEGERHETMFCSGGVHRYTRRDFGRVTGTDHAYTDPRNIPPLYTAPHPSPAQSEGFKVEVSTLHAAGPVCGGSQG